MSDNNYITLKPVIVIDLVKNRIRIHKQTIHKLGDPSSILLLVNPDKHTFGIVGCKDNESGSHRVNLDNIKNNCYELYSRSLIRSLQTVCPQWENGKKYRIVGELLPTENAVCFSMAKSEPISNME